MRRRCSQLVRIQKTISTALSDFFFLKHIFHDEVVLNFSYDLQSEGFFLEMGSLQSSLFCFFYRLRSHRDFSLDQLDQVVGLSTLGEGTYITSISIRKEKQKNFCGVGKTPCPQAI